MEKMDFGALLRRALDKMVEGEEGVDIRQLTDAELRNLLEAEDG